jgi:hypothetical protein
VSFTSAGTASLDEVGAAGKLEKPGRGGRLQGRELKVSGGVTAEDEVVGPVAKIADSVEEQNGAPDPLVHSTRAAMRAPQGQNWRTVSIQ